MENNTHHMPTAVLLMAYGSPEKIEDVAPYFTHIRGGVRPDEALIKEIEARYRRVGGKTPLREITERQAAALQALLDGRAGARQFKVYVGMKHWHPFIKDVLAEIKTEGIKNVIAIALAPHYSKMSIGGYEKLLNEAGEGLRIRLVEHWHANPHLIECIAVQVGESLVAGRAAGPTDAKTPHLVFTAHSVPTRIREWNDPYESQLLETARLVAARFPGHAWSFSFQSAGHTPEPWLGPDILETLTRLKGHTHDHVLVCSVGFVADNLEILFDLDVKAREEAARLGMRLERVPMRNIHPLFIEALYDIIME